MKASSRWMFAAVALVIHLKVGAAGAADSVPSTDPATPANPNTSTTSTTSITSTTSNTSTPSTPSPNPNYQSDDGSLNGDHLTVFVNVDQVVEYFNPKVRDRCIPAGAKMKVIRQSDQEILVRMVTVPQRDEFVMTDLKNLGITGCGDRAVNLHTVYSIPRSHLLEETYKRTGVTFGALVVPFKFRVAESKELSSSATLAPYVGARLDWLQGFGFSLTPIFSAGLALVPITDQVNNTTTTKAAPSIGVGLILTSSKNNQFNAGVIFGKDLVSRTDRALDPRAYENWISFYIGTSR